MTALLADTSVVLKWFQSHGEGEVIAARALRDASATGGLDVRILDLGVYEFGNVLLRRLRFGADEVADQVHDLLTLVGAPIGFRPRWLHPAAALAERHELSFHDAAWAAAARDLRIPLVSADRQLLDAGLAESATGMAIRLDLIR